MTKLTDFISVSDLKSFWEIVEELPDIVDGKEYKKNIRKFFSPTDKKALIVKLSSSEDFQKWHDTHVFIRGFIKRQIHLKILRDHVQKKLDHIKSRKGKNHDTK